MRVWIEESVTLAIASRAAASAPSEAGGVLAGWTDGDDIVIAFATVGGPKAVATPTSYYPDHEWQERELERAFCRSDGDLTYMGDWHSHPSGPSQLSRTDVSTLRAIVGVRPEGCMLLCAPANADWGVSAWRLERGFLGFARAVRTNVVPFTAPGDWPNFPCSVGDRTSRQIF